MVFFPNFIKIPKCHFCKLQIIPNPEFLTKKLWINKNNISELFVLQPETQDCYKFDEVMIDLYLKGVSFSRSRFPSFRLEVEDVFL